MFTNQDLPEIVRYIEYFDWVHPEKKGQFFYQSFSNVCPCCGPTGRKFTALEYVCFLTIDQIQQLHDRSLLDLKKTEYVAPAIEKWAHYCQCYMGECRATVSISHVMNIIERFCIHSEIAKYSDDGLTLLDIIYFEAETISKMPTYFHKFAEWGLHIPDQHYLFSRIIIECDIPSCHAMISLGYDVSRFHLFSMDITERSAFSTFHRLLRHLFDTTVEEEIFFHSYLKNQTKKELKQHVSEVNQERSVKRESEGYTNVYPILHLLIRYGFDTTAPLHGSMATTLQDLMTRAKCAPYPFL
jgi:hypothetical protein